MNGIQKHIGNFIYEDNRLACILTPEGRALPDGNGGFEYQYYLKDHLGNTRIMFDENKTVLQNYSYYPFGLEMSGFDFMPATTLNNKYLSNRKELQDDSGLEWYDYGTWFYDVVIGSWHAPEASSEECNNSSNYNNPTIFIDPNGTERAIFNTILSIPSSVLGIGINQTIKRRLNE